MPTDITVALENRPGTLAALGRATGEAGVNIDGIAGVATDGGGLIHLLVEDAAAAREALEGAGFEVRDQREVLVVECEDRPGELARLAEKVAGCGRQHRPRLPGRQRHPPGAGCQRRGGGAGGPRLTRVPVRLRRTGPP